MPYNIWCGGCNSMIAKGVRFNAKKKQVGNYYSTKIWSFAMKSPCCKHEIVIQTDPQNCEYVITGVALKKVEEYDVEDAETIELTAAWGRKGKACRPILSSRTPRSRFAKEESIRTGFSPSPESLGYKTC